MSIIMSMIMVTCIIMAMKMMRVMFVLMMIVVVMTTNMMMLNLAYAPALTVRMMTTMDMTTAMSIHMGMENYWPKENL
jgi:hypothetical protein